MAAGGHRRRFGSSGVSDVRATQGLGQKGKGKLETTKQTVKLTYQASHIISTRHGRTASAILMADALQIHRVMYTRRQDCPSCERQESATRNSAPATT